MVETCADRLGRARAGDERAWGEIVAVYTPALRAIFRKLGVPDQEADVVLNDVWKRCHRWLPGFRRERTGAFRAGLRTIARKVAAEFHERSARDRIRTLDTDGWEGVNQDVADDDFRDLADRIDRKELIEALLGALGNEIPEESKTILRLTYWDGLNATEIGGSIGKSPEAVRKARSRAIGDLREILTDYYGIDGLDSRH